MASSNMLPVDNVDKLKTTLVQRYVAAASLPEPALHQPPNAMTFSQLVIREYAEHREIYQAYLEAEGNAERCRHDPNGTTEMIKRLFKDMPYLIDPALSIILSPFDAGAAKDEALGREHGVTDALAYLELVKADPSRHKAFLILMQQFRSNQVDVAETTRRVAELFHDSPELVEGFNTFLPPGYQMGAFIHANEPNTVVVNTPQKSFVV